jgi:hypothetical protein
MAKVHNHFASASRVLKRRKEALGRLRNSATPLEKDKRVKKNPRTQEALVEERVRLTDLIAGGGRKEKVLKAWNVNDLDRAR